MNDINNKLKLIYCFGYAKSKDCKSYINEPSFNSLQEKIKTLVKCDDKDFKVAQQLFGRSYEKDNYKEELIKSLGDKCSGIEKVIEGLFSTIETMEPIISSNKKLREFTYLGEQRFTAEMQEILKIRPKNDKTIKERCAKLKNKLLFDDIYSREIESEGNLTNIDYKNRFYFAKSLLNIIGEKNIDEYKYLTKTKLWNWLTLYSIDEIFRVNTGRAEENFILTETFKSTDIRRHYLYGAFRHFHIYRDSSYVMLTKKLGRPGEAYEQISVINVDLTPTMMDVLNEIYVDKKTKDVKVGYCGKSEGKGHVRRFNKIADVLAMSFVIHAIDDSEDYFRLLSSINDEFEELRT